MANNGKNGKSSRPLLTVQIPRRRERVIIIGTMLKLAGIFDGFVTHKSASHYDVSYVALAVFHGHLSGRPMTAGKIALTLSMARSTTLDRLDFLIKRGYVRKYGRYYYADDRYLTPAPPYIDTAKGIIAEAARQIIVLR